MPEQPSKHRIRARLLAARRALAPALRERHNAVIQSEVIRLPVWKSARGVGIYLSLPDEVGTFRLIQAAQAEGKIVAVPRVVPAGQQLEFHRFPGENHLLPGPLGILQPGILDPIAPSQLDLLILPGIGFDLAGNRLGFGGGYFDRLLAGYSGPTVGLAFEVQIVADLPLEPYDRPVQWVVTEKRVLGAG